MEQINLQAKSRKIFGKKVKTLRNQGQIPAILYGKKFKPIPLMLDKGEFLKVSQKAGEATIINLDIDNNKKEKILIREIQKEPIHDKINHVDLYKIDMTTEIETEIPLEFVGQSIAVDELEGNLIQNKDSIKVECLPDKLVSVIKVDISSLKTFEDLVHVKDLSIPEGIKVLEDQEDIVAQVTPPRSEEELKAMEEEAASDTEKAQIENIEAEAEKEAEKEKDNKEDEGQTTEEAESAPESEKNEEK